MNWLAEIWRHCRSAETAQRPKRSSRRHPWIDISHAHVTGHTDNGTADQRRAPNVGLDGDVAHVRRGYHRSTLRSGSLDLDFDPLPLGIGLVIFLEQPDQERGDASHE